MVIGAATQMETLPSHRGIDEIVFAATHDGVGRIETRARSLVVRHDRGVRMPKYVRRFAWLWWLHILIALGALAQLPPSSFLSKLGVTPPMQMGMSGFGTVVITLVLLPFWFAVRKGRDWARWVLFAAFAISIPNLLLDPTGYQAAYLPLTGIRILSLLVNAAAFYFVFSVEAQPWFTREATVLT
jgi:hypothetical protein